MLGMPFGGGLYALVVEEVRARAAGDVVFRKADQELAGGVELVGVRAGLTMPWPRMRSPSRGSRTRKHSRTSICARTALLPMASLEGRWVAAIRLTAGAGRPPGCDPRPPVMTTALLDCVLLLSSVLKFRYGTHVTRAPALVPFQFSSVCKDGHQMPGNAVVGSTRCGWRCLAVSA